MKKATGRTLLRSEPITLVDGRRLGQRTPAGEVYSRTFNTHHTVQLLVTEHPALVEKLRDPQLAQRVLDRLNERTTPIFVEVLAEVTGIRLGDVGPKGLDT